MGRRGALVAASVAGLAVVLTGCMKIDVDYSVNTDDTVDGTMIMAVSRDLAEMSGESDTMVEEMLGDESIPEGASAERYEDDDFVGAKYTFDAIPLEDLNLDASDSESLSITHEGDEFVASGVMDLSDTGMDDLGDDAGQFGQGFMDSMEIRIAITFPGEVIETNGEVDGTTVVWEPVPGEKLEISARAADSGGAGGLPIWAWIVIGVVVVAALGGLIYVMTRTRRQGQDETAGEAPAQQFGFPPAPAGTAQPGTPGGAPAAPGSAPGSASAEAGAAPMTAAGAAAAAASTGGVPETADDADTTAMLDRLDAEELDDDSNAADVEAGEPDLTEQTAAPTDDAAGPVADVPPVAPPYEQPTTFGAQDDDVTGTGAPTAPEPPADVTGVAEGTAETDSTEEPGDAGGDTLEPPR